jgi:hypothetical protein
MRFVFKTMPNTNLSVFARTSLVDISCSYGGYFLHLILLVVVTTATIAIVIIVAFQSDLLPQWAKPENAISSIF